MAEGKKGNKQLCELVKFLGAMGIANDDDTTTGANLNWFIQRLQKFFPGIEIPIKILYDGTSVVDATESDTTTGEDLNRLIAAVKGVLPDIDVEDTKAEDWDTTTGANLNGLLAAIIKGVASTICAQDVNIAILGQKILLFLEDSILFF